MSKNNSASEPFPEETGQKEADAQTGAEILSEEDSGKGRAGTESSGDPYADASLEEILDCLESTLSKMDSPDIPLEEAFTLYEQGMKMVAAADGKLKKVEQKLSVINGETDA